ncbi:22547_t:CDS:2, partial [Gigaspora margarita]
LTRDIRVTDPLDNYDKVWKGNLACNIIKKVDSVKEYIRNITKNKENWTLPCVLDLLLQRKYVGSPSEHKLINSIEIAEMEIELINGLNLEKETKDMLSSM